MRNKYRPLYLSVVALAVGGMAGSRAYAEEEKSPIEQAVDYRSSVMTVFAWNLKPMGAMVKGKMPYDNDTFARHASDLAAAASLNVLAGFPEGSDESDETAAKAEIWMLWGEFEDKFKALQRESAKLADVAKGAELEQIKEQFATTAETCKSCHKEFKE